MSDAADFACTHAVVALERDVERVEWLCFDCGRVFASLDAPAFVDSPRVLDRWLAQTGVPDRSIASAVRRGVLPELVGR